MATVTRIEYVTEIPITKYIGVDGKEIDVLAEQQREVHDLVTAMVRAVCHHPDRVEVKAVGGERTVVFECVVAEDDYGRVLGKSGRMAGAMRIVLAGACKRADVKYGFNVVTREVKAK